MSWAEVVIVCVALVCATLAAIFGTLDGTALGGLFGAALGYLTKGAVNEVKSDGN